MKRAVNHQKCYCMKSVDGINSTDKQTDRLKSCFKTSTYLVCIFFFRGELEGLAHGDDWAIPHAYVVKYRIPVQLVIRHV